MEGERGREGGRERIADSTMYASSCDVARFAANEHGARAGTYVTAVCEIPYRISGPAPSKNYRAHAALRR